MTHVDLRRWVRARGITVRIARKGIETSKKLGKRPLDDRMIDRMAVRLSPTQPT